MLSEGDLGCANVFVVTSNTVFVVCTGRIKFFRGLESTGGLETLTRFWSHLCCFGHERARNWLMPGQGSFCLAAVCSGGSKIERAWDQDGHGFVSS